MSKLKLRYESHAADAERKLMFRLRSIRESKGLTQRVLADMVGTQASSVCNAENGTTHPSVFLVSALLDVMGYELKIVRKER